MLEGLETLEEDMHLHVHKENNILFPRAIRLETSLADASGMRPAEAAGWGGGRHPSRHPSY
jgi:hypothetical protein